MRGRRAQQVRLLAACGPGMALQAAALAGFFVPWPSELALFVGALVYGLGCLAVVFVLERGAAALGRGPNAPLLGLLGPPGALAFVALGSPSQPPPPRAGVRRLPAGGVPGAVATLAVAGLAAWAGATWASLAAGPRQPTAAEMQRRELLAYRRLGEIAAAQQRYREQDPDGDGRRTFAAFHIHLWRSVDRQGKGVPVGLITRELGRAMTPTHALDGYIYKDVHSSGVLAALRGERPQAPSRPLDPAAQWAVVALPTDAGKSALLPLVAESSGAVWTLGPDAAPAAGGPGMIVWTRVASEQELQAIQRRTDYSVRSAPGGRWFGLPF